MDKSLFFAIGVGFWAALSSQSLAASTRFAMLPSKGHSFAVEGGNPAATPSAQAGLGNSKYLAKQYATGNSVFPSQITQCIVDLKSGRVQLLGEIGTGAETMDFATGAYKLNYLKTGPQIAEVIAKSRSEPLQGNCQVDGPPTTQYWYLDGTEVANSFMFVEICPPKPGLGNTDGEYLKMLVDVVCPASFDHVGFQPPPQG